MLPGPCFVLCRSVEVTHRWDIFSEALGLKLTVTQAVWRPSAIDMEPCSLLRITFFQAFLLFSLPPFALFNIMPEHPWSFHTGLQTKDFLPVRIIKVIPLPKVGVWGGGVSQSNNDIPETQRWTLEPCLSHWGWPVQGYTSLAKPRIDLCIQICCPRFYVGIDMTWFVCPHETSLLNSYDRRLWL